MTPAPSSPFNPIPAALRPAPAPPVAPAKTPAPSLNPASLLGNTLRMAPMYPNYIMPPPLDLDAALAAGQVVFDLGGYPYPYAPYAGPYAPNVWAANMQCATDWGLITYFAGWRVSNPNGTPPPQKLTDWATYTGEQFIYKGVLWVPGVWSPF